MKKTVICLILIFSVLFGLAACGKKDETEQLETETVTETVAYFVDDEGVSHRVESSVDSNGETQYAYEENGTVVTVKDTADVVVATTVIAIPKKSTTQDVNEAAESLLAELTKNLAANQDQTKATLQFDNTFPVDHTSVIATNAAGTTKRGGVQKQTYKEIIDGGTYTMKFNLKTTNKATGESTVSPITMAVDGNKSYVSATMEQEGTSLEVNYINDGKDSYFAVPSIRAYTKADAEFIEDIVPDLSESVKSDAVPVGDPYSVTVGGRVYTCDEYDYNGENVKYYSYNGDIERIETSNADTVTIMEIISLVNAANPNYFKIPSDFIDLETLGDKYSLGS